MSIQLDLNAPPNCPKCGKPVFRAGKMSTTMDGTSTLEGAFTVCMYCSEIWELSGTLENLNLKKATPEQLALAPFLVDAAKTFEAHRAAAKIIGMPYDLFADLIGKANHGRRQMQGPIH